MLFHPSTVLILLSFIQESREDKFLFTGQSSNLFPTVGLDLDIAPIVVVIIVSRVCMSRGSRRGGVSGMVVDVAELGKNTV